MIYELINPSDAITFEAPDLKIAGLVTILLGEGAYAANPEDDTQEGVPLMIFDGPEEWWNAHFSEEPWQDSAKTFAAQLVPALRSVCCASFSQRRLFDIALESIDDPEKRQGFIDKWNDMNCTSMNNIVGRAQEFAAFIEIKYLGESGVV